MKNTPKLYCYKCTYRFGPGHQSSATIYNYSFHKLTKPEKLKYWEDNCVSYWDDAVGEIKHIKKLPDSEWMKHVQHFENELEHCNEILAALKENSNDTRKT
jgi:hypothetical protein